MDARHRHPPKVREKGKNVNTADIILDILEELKPDVDFATRTDLVDSRELDSLLIIALVGDLEDAFGIAIPAVEIVPVNFNSVAGIASMVERLIESGF